MMVQWRRCYVSLRALVKDYRETIVEYETAIVSFRLLLKETREKDEMRESMQMQMQNATYHTHGCDAERYGDPPV